MELLYTTLNEPLQLSDEDVRTLAHYSWHLNCDGYPTNNHGKLMHRIIGDRMGIVGKVDHRDRNKLNCQRSNLRVATCQENNRNVDGRAASGYKGVYYNSKGKRPWVSSIRVNGRNKHLGVFETAIEAALAYDRAARLYYGEFGVFNFAI